jgi:acetylornithine deacetylase
VSVGRIAGGTWSSSVPDRLVFEGRVGVPLGMAAAQVQARLEDVVRDVCPQASVTWTGGRFNPAETPAEHPFAQLVMAAARDELGRDVRPIGVTYGADMRLFCERGIPCVMFGTPGLARAHAVDEHVAVSDLMALSRTLIRVIAASGGS